ncbi:MAG: hypothetical protein V4539_24165 [Bacteroidota bacterium]
MPGSYLVRIWFVPGSYHIRVFFGVSSAVSEETPKNVRLQPKKYRRKIEGSTNEVRRKYEGSTKKVSP